MEIERQRGISVSSSVMSFEHRGLVFNLLDTPGHEDFSEDTYRTLTAVDSAIMVIDAARGIEAQTRKLFEVCRLRDVPIMTFINKIDREGRDPFELLDEIERTLALDVAPVTWPVGMGSAFRGSFELRRDRLLLPSEAGEAARAMDFAGIGDPELDRRVERGHAGRLPRRRGAGAAGLPQARHRGLSRGPSEPGLFRQRAQGLRGRRPARRPRPVCAAAAARSRRSRARSARRSPR